MQCLLAARIVLQGKSNPTGTELGVMNVHRASIKIQKVRQTAKTVLPESIPVQYLLKPSQRAQNVSRERTLGLLVALVLQFVWIVDQASILEKDLLDVQTVRPESTKMVLVGLPVTIVPQDPSLLQVQMLRQTVHIAPPAKDPSIKPIALIVKLESTPHRLPNSPVRIATMDIFKTLHAKPLVNLVLPQNIHQVSIPPTPHALIVKRESTSHGMAQTRAQIATMEIFKTLQAKPYVKVVMSENLHRQLILQTPHAHRALLDTTNLIHDRPNAARHVQQDLFL